MLQSVEADDYMSKTPLIFKTDTDIFDAIHMILQRKLSGGTVVDDDNIVVGVISEMDCLKALVHAGYYNEGGGTVGDFMTKGCDAIPSGLNIVDAAQLLLEKGRRRMPVVENGKFAGQISARGILQAFKDSFTEHDSTEDDD